MWIWRYEGRDGAVTPPGTGAEDFPTQSDAESWLGEHWRELRAAGVDQVTLFENGSLVYGPMSLHEPE
jgi:hypothetical protein